MDTPSILCDQLIDYKMIPDYNEYERRLNTVYSFALVTQTVDLVIDHYKKTTWLYHYNPDCVELFGGMGRKQYAGNYFDRLVHPEDTDLYAQIASAIKDSIRNDILKGDKNYFFSFTVRLGVTPEDARMYSLRAVPFLFTPDNTHWVTVYYMEPATEPHPGNLVLHAVKQKAFFHFNRERNRFGSRVEMSKLPDVERKILRYAAEGFTESEIAEMLNLPVSKLKNQKMKMFNRLSVSSVSAAIALAYKRGLLD